VLYIKDGSGAVYYNKYSGSWGGETDSGWDEGTSPTSLTPNYSSAGAVFAEWTSGAGSPYTVNWDYIVVPELLWLFLPFGFLLPLIVKLRKKRSF
jgi:hypothetical protein